MKALANAYCTLFDSMYADKGLVMLRSLRAFDQTSDVYVLCMDELCYSILSAEKIEKLVPIALEDFLDDELRSVRAQRGKGEFCWSCTGKLIQYVLDRYGAQYCTYLDSDLFFYSDPSVLIREMLEKDCTVQVIPHRFPNKRRWRIIEQTSGKNCVQFNTFSNSEDSRALLNTWIGQCMEKCDKYSGGDQLYTSNWGEYPFVSLSENDGGGLAPWNIEKYTLAKNREDSIRRKSDGKEFALVFYHFQGLEYLDRYTVNIHIRNKITLVDSRLLSRLYEPYLLELEDMKRRLEEEYQIVPLYSHTTGLFGGEKKKRSLKQILSDAVEKQNRKADTIHIGELCSRSSGGMENG